MAIHGGQSTEQRRRRASSGSKAMRGYRLLGFLNRYRFPADLVGMAEEEDFVYYVKGEGHLITNKAGASARQQADELRAAEPVRTRLARLLKVHTDERAYRIGADGEEEVGRRLDKLDPSKWLALHDIIRNHTGTNVDHLVIGPAGVFSLNTKHHPKGKVVVTEKGLRVNGYRTNYLPVAVSEAAKVGQVLERAVGHPVAIRPVIVIMGAELEARSATPDVDVIRRRDLPKWFTRLPEVLGKAQTQDLMAAAGRPSTWKPAPPVEQTALSVKAWSRHGKKRLYVNDAAGKTLGYRDEITGEVHVTDERDLDRVRAALSARR